MNATATKTACTCSLIRIFAEDGTLTTTGCVATTKRTFAPGHDARMKGFLIRAGIAGHKVRIGADGEERSAQAVADQFGFGNQVRDGIANGQARALAPKKSRKAKAEPKPETVTAKVGRWVYEGVLDVHKVWFTYTDKKGTVRNSKKWTLV